MFLIKMLFIGLVFLKLVIDKLLCVGGLVGSVCL